MELCSAGLVDMFFVETCVFGQRGCDTRTTYILVLENLRNWEGVSKRWTHLEAAPGQARGTKGQ